MASAVNPSELRCIACIASDERKCKGASTRSSVDLLFAIALHPAEGESAE